MGKRGYLVISLDFELLWGVFDKVQWKEKKKYFQNTRELIPRILELFKQYEISCTWATVGMLFNENWDEWEHNLPNVYPNYENESLSAYNFGRSVQIKETEEMCFAPGLIKLIKETPGQEIGTHTYSHYYCLEPGQSLENFKSDLLLSRKMADKFDIQLNSLVFPRNQFNPEYLSICREVGISSVRSNPNNWYWQNTQKDGLKHKIFRTGDAYLGLKDKSYGISEVVEVQNGLLAQKASRLLRPYSGNGFADNLKLRRITHEMKKAARNGEVYHLWWHPHNFGENPEKSLFELRLILDHFKECQSKYNMVSDNMRGIGVVQNTNISV